jgi:hypothetical protein
MDRFFEVAPRQATKDRSVKRPSQYSRLIWLLRLDKNSALFRLT